MVCRVCLKDSEHVLQIFDEVGKEKNISEIVQKHLWFMPKSDDPISNVICEVCWCKLNEFHEFYEVVEQAHKLYNEIYNFESTDKEIVEVDHAIELAETVYEVKREEVMDELPSEKAENPLSTAVNPLYEPELVEQVVVKAEIPESDSLDNLDDSNSMNYEEIASDYSGESNSDEELTSNSSGSMLITKHSREIDTLTTIKSGIRKVKRTKFSKTLNRKLLSNSEIKSSISSKIKQEKRCWTKPLDDEMVRKHLPLNCELCGFLVDSFTDMINHFRASHRDTRPYILCCGRRLSKRQRAVQHAYHHEDPNYFQCEICKRSFSDNYVLRSHMLAHHPAEEDLTHQCDQCEKRFSRRYLLELHKPVHIPVEERKFLCTKCPTPKAFASDHLRQIHDNMRHKRATNVCHVCAKEIRDNQAFEKHVRLHFEDSGPRVKCPRPGCDRWLKDEDNLKQHLRRHNDEGKIITCEQCGKSVKNRRALSSHMSYAHSKALFSCEECKKTFKKAITLKEHMAQHTGETLYKCPFCPRTFNSNANMHSHKKKMHPVEWDVWRKTKTGSSQHVKSNEQVLETVATSMFQNITHPIITIEPHIQQPNPIYLQGSDADLLDYK